jgi:hypothetical protein
MAEWTADQLATIAASTDLHLAPFRAMGDSFPHPPGVDRTHHPPTATTPDRFRRPRQGLWGTSAVSGGPTRPYLSTTVDAR